MGYHNNIPPDIEVVISDDGRAIFDEELAPDGSFTGRLTFLIRRKSDKREVLVAFWPQDFPDDSNRIMDQMGELILSACAQLDAKS